MPEKFKILQTEETVQGERGMYVLRRVLGQGGSARVFAAREIKTGAPVAIKTLKTARSEDGAEEQAEQIVKEGIFLLQLRHSGLVPLLDHNLNSSDTPFLVLARAYGSVNDEMQAREGRMPLQRSLNIVEQMGIALDYTHGEGVVHRDVKPHNMLLANATQFWLHDFGIARRVDNHIQLGETNTGTAAYSSPEQIMGDVTPAGDQYSLGIVAFYLLTGRLPFDGLDLVGMQLRQEPPTLAQAIELRPGESVSHIIRALEAPIGKALSKMPNRRFNSVLRFVQELHSRAEEAEHGKDRKLYPVGFHPIPLEPIGTPGRQDFNGFTPNPRVIRGL